MKFIKLFLFIATLNIVAFDTYAQFSETIFYDTTTKVSSDGFVHSCLADGKYIYVSGSSFSQSAPLPTVTKMDTSGAVIWTATDEQNYNRFGGYYGFENSMASCMGTIKSGNRLFTTAEPKTYSLASTLLHEVWCISDSTGLLLWKLNINNCWIVRIADYSDTSIIAITRASSIFNAFASRYEYHLIHKNTGALIYSKHFGDAGVSLTNEANVFVDNNKNILLSWDDTCRKFRDDRLSQLVWTSHIPYNGSLKMIDEVKQSDHRYYFFGRNNVRCVDTLNGATVWYNQYPSIGYVAGVQPGGDVRPKDILIRDSLIFITWYSVYVGSVGLDRAFILTRMNKTNGYLKYTVAHDFAGIPPDPPPSSTSEIDWPFKICMDDNRNIYMVGSYDRAPGGESPGNWGIMRINSESGQKVYEATITDNPTKRSERSQAKFVHYIDGKLYALGNLEKAQDPQYARPLFMSFDTTITFRERFRKGIDAVLRYPSSLKCIMPFSASKMALLKKVGRSSVVELRSINNQLLWSSTFNSPAKFMIPQNMTAMSDTGIAASFILYNETADTKIMPGVADSLVFVRFDTAGNIKFLHRIKYNLTDTLTAVQIYKDNLGKVSFIYRGKNGALNTYRSYMLGGNSATLSSIGNNFLSDADTSVLRLNAVQQYNIDTMVCYQAGTPGFFSGGRLHSATQTSLYQYFGYRPIRYFAGTQSSFKLDSVSFFVMGRDSSGQIRGARYNHRLANPLVWSYVSAVNGILYNADSSSQFLYTVAMGLPAKKLIISKINRLTGTDVWDYTRTPVAKTAILPVDLRYDKFNRRFTTGGFITDSSRSGTGTAYFYFTLDSTGAIIKDVIRQGFGLGETRINSIDLMQNGTNIYGGSVSLPDYGTVGFYNSDCTGNMVVPSVSISSPAGSFCSGSVITFTAIAVNGGASPTYEWKVNGITAGTNSSTFTSGTLSNGALVQVIMTSNANCLQTATATSNVLSVNIVPELAASVSITGSTSVFQGQSSLITVIPINGGSAPAYQWQDSTAAHDWQNISGAVNSTINYSPAHSGDKLRAIMTSNMNCVRPIPVSSNVITFTVNTVTSISPTPASGFGIVYYPNPVISTLVIDSLKLSDRWETFIITTIEGQHASGVIDVRNRKTVTINLSYLPAGQYVGILNGKNRARAYLRFQKL